MQLLTSEAQVGIKIHWQKFQWIDPLSNKTVNDGCLLLNEVLKMMRPCPTCGKHSTQPNVFCHHPLKQQHISALREDCPRDLIVRWWGKTQSTGGQINTHTHR
jgi:hypothetical protein